MWSTLQIKIDKAAQSRSEQAHNRRESWFGHTQEICSMLLVPVFWPVRLYSSAASTASPPMDTLSAPDLKYSEATSRADQCLPSASVNSLMPPPTVNGTNTPSLACLTTCTKVEGVKPCPTYHLKLRFLSLACFTTCNKHSDYSTHGDAYMIQSQLTILHLMHCRLAVKQQWNLITLPFAVKQQ